MRYTRLIVRDFRTEMPIGIFEKDKTELCPLIIHLEAEVRLPEHWQADSYEQILGYDKLVDMIGAVTRSGHLNLVETLAESLAERCFAWPQIQTVKIRVEKAEIYPHCIPGVEIYRQRA